MRGDKDPVGGRYFEALYDCDRFLAAFGKMIWRVEMAWNQIALMGRMTRGPGLRPAQAEKASAAISLVMDRDFAPDDGEHRGDCFGIVTWGKAAEFVSPCLAKGQLATVGGRRRLRDGTDRDGNKCRCGGGRDFRSRRPATGVCSALSEADDGKMPF